MICSKQVYCLRCGLLLLLASCLAPSIKALPHVSECNFCQVCHVTPSSAGGSTTAQRRRSLLDASTGTASDDASEEGYSDKLTGSSSFLGADGRAARDSGHSSLSVQRRLLQSIWRQIIAGRPGDPPAGGSSSHGSHGPHTTTADSHFSSASGSSTADDSFDTHQKNGIDDSAASNVSGSSSMAASSTGDSTDEVETHVNNLASDARVVQTSGDVSSFRSSSGAPAGSPLGSAAVELVLDEVEHSVLERLFGPKGGVHHLSQQSEQGLSRTKAEVQHSRSSHSTQAAHSEPHSQGTDEKEGLASGGGSIAAAGSEKGSSVARQQPGVKFSVDTSVQDEKWVAQEVQQAMPHASAVRHCHENSDSSSSTGMTVQSHSGTQHWSRNVLQQSKATSAAPSKRKADPPGTLLLPDSGLAPRIADVAAKYLLPNCSECTGCTTKIEPLQNANAFGQDWKLDQGASPEWLFNADLPETATTGRRAVLKVWCMPVDKVHKTFRWLCNENHAGAKSVHFLLAQQKVVEECGLLDATIKVWLAPVNAVLPDYDLHIWWNGLWMEKAPGISFNQMSYVTKKSWVLNTTIDLLHNKLNTTRVVMAAMIDLLTSQCDRHSQNIFISEDGNIKLIDNQQALQYSWIKCGADSVFLPGTQKNEVVRFGGNWVGKRAGGATRRSLNPMVILDYRCYVPGGAIGTNYPPQLAQCLKKIAGMSREQVQTKYGFPALRSAEVLRQRALDMIDKGFEWTLQRGQPLNMPPQRYKWHQPCCKLNFDPQKGITCGHAWNVTPSLPFGDPIGGGVWKRGGQVDPGTFVGGSQFEEE